MDLNIVKITKVIHESEFLSLYIGENANGQSIIISLLDEEDEKGFYLMYLYVISDQLDQFLIGEISYLELLQNADKIFKVDTDYNYNILSKYLTTYKQLETLGTIPSEDSFITNFTTNLL